MTATSLRADQEAVLITGCSSGIGRQTAITLTGHGFLVFATVRRQADAERLRGLGISTLIPVCPLDLTNLDQVSGAADLVAGELDRLGIDGLYALINNAGGGSPSPIELLDLEAFRTELEARVLGSVAMVQAFLPQIRRAGGRIIWIATPALMPTPYVASIHACDFAVNCIARTLDIELKRWDIPNILIRCGGIRTPAGLRTTQDVDALLEAGSRERVALYEGALKEWAKDMAEFDEKRTDPDRVANAICKALTARRPRRRYAVGHLVRAAGFLELMPESWADWILKKRF